MKRRQLLKATAAGAALSLCHLRLVHASPESMVQAIKAAFGERTMQEGRVQLDLPKLAENGNVVPVTVSVDSPMTERDHVQSIHLFSEKNPLPEMAEFRLGPHNGKARVSTRVRLAETQRVVAVAALSDGTLWSATVEVVVTITGCG